MQRKEPNILTKCTILCNQTIDSYSKPFCFHLLNRQLSLRIDLYNNGLVLSCLIMFGHSLLNNERSSIYYGQGFECV